MTKILTIGSASQDIFFPTSEGVIMDTPKDLLSQKKLAFELGAKYHVSERFESIGGCSVNVAAGLAKLGNEVSAYTTIGDDVTGEWIYGQLEKVGIKMDCVDLAKKCKSDLSAIVVDQNAQDRVIFSNQMANQKLVVNPEKIFDFGWIFIGDLSGAWQNNLDLIVATAKEKNISLAFNPRQKTIHEDASKIIEIAASCDLLFVNKDEAMEIVSASVGSLLSEDETYLISELRKMGAKVVALTDGKRGAWAFEGKEIFHVEAILHSNTVDTTGAGDAFASGFLAGYLKQQNLGSALKWGVANSSSSVTKYGGQAGLLNEEQIESAIKDITVK